MTNKLRWYAKTYIGFILAFFYIPILVMIAYSFNESKSRTFFTGFTLDWYNRLFTNDLIISSLQNTLIIAFAASITATVIGTAAAIGLYNMNKWLKSVMLNFTYLPIVNPEIITGVSFMLLFVSIQALIEGINTSFGAAIPMLEFGRATLILAHITFCLPYVILNVMPKLRQMDKNIYEAALDLGCNEWQAFYKIVVPDIMPGIIAGFLTSFTMSLDDFIISYFVTGPTSQTLPITIFSMTRRRVSPEINALSAIIFVVVLLVLLTLNFYDIRREKHMLKRMEVRSRA
ncbi:MAG: ABC transporter permease [Oscillospiraceae bacterium]|nr:ABC transporter permease [Oscillospiraceae bacterium]